MTLNSYSGRDEFLKRNPIERSGYMRSHVFHFVGVLRPQTLIMFTQLLWNKQLARERVGSSFLEQSGTLRPFLMLCCVLVWLSGWVQFDCVTTVMWTIDKWRHACVFRPTAVSSSSLPGWGLVTTLWAHFRNSNSREGFWLISSFCFN